MPDVPAGSAPSHLISECPRQTEGLPAAPGLPASTFYGPFTAVLRFAPLSPDNVPNEKPLAGHALRQRAM